MSGTPAELTGDGVRRLEDVFLDNTGRSLPMSLDLSPAPGAAPLARQVRAQASMEVRLLLRNGEQLLLAVVIPVLVLIGGRGRCRTRRARPGPRAGRRADPGRAGAGDHVDVVHVAGDRDRLRAPLRRPQAAGRDAAAAVGTAGRARCWRCWSSRSSSWWCSRVSALALGWSPSAGVVGLIGFVLAVVLGTAAFASLGLLLAGTLARGGDAGGRQPRLPAAPRRRGRGAADLVVRRVRRRRPLAAVGGARRRRAGGVPRRRDRLAPPSPVCWSGRRSAASSRPGRSSGSDRHLRAVASTAGVGDPRRQRRARGDGRRRAADRVRASAARPGRAARSRRSPRTARWTSTRRSSSATGC